MHNISVYFKGHDPIKIELINHPVAEKFYHLAKKHYTEYPVVFRDNVKYTMNYFSKLAQEANDKLGWNWKTQDFTNDDTIIMHKDLEEILNDEGNFLTIPEHLDHLIHELHYCLHRIQFKEKPNRIGHFQIEWFNNDYIDITDDFNFSTNIKFGDIILLNPFVGHNPLHCYLDDDFSNITRTCRIPSRIKSGIVMFTSDNLPKVDLNDYKQWWITKGAAFTDLFGYDTILQYTGEGKIGEVTNKDNLIKIINSPDILEFDKLSFIET